MVTRSPREESIKSSECDYSQPFGLDVGTSRIVVARSWDKSCQFEAELNAFVTLPYTKLTASLLGRENVFHEVRGQEIIVAGNDAQRFAEIFHVETRRPMRDGLLNPQEPHSLAVVRQILMKLLGKAKVEGQKGVFSIPAGTISGEGSLTYHEASLRRVLSELGYSAKAINEGLAVVFGELGDSNYTGIGISCGSGLSNVCLSVLSVPVITFCTAKAGDFIDAHAARVTGEVANRVRIFKEQTFHLNGFSPDHIEHALTIYHDDVIKSLVNSLREHFSSPGTLAKLDQPVPLVISGGTSMPKGFIERFEKALSAQDFPLRLAEIRLAADPLNSTARGALMAALCD